MRGLLLSIFVLFWLGASCGLAYFYARIVAETCEVPPRRSPFDFVRVSAMAFQMLNPQEVWKKHKQAFPESWDRFWCLVFFGGLLVSFLIGVMSAAQ